MKYTDKDEMWAQITGGRQLKVGDNIYFVKTRSDHGQISVYLPEIAVSEQNVQTELTYRLRMKEIATGKIYSVTMSFKANGVKDDRDRWPMYGYIPKECEKPASGTKLYARFEPFDVFNWFVSPKEEPLDYFGRFGNAEDLS